MIDERELKVKQKLEKNKLMSHTDSETKCSVTYGLQYKIKLS
jgi:hypothetical protein